MSAPRRRAWTVHAIVLRVVDGDTLQCCLDLGWSISLGKAKVRLGRVNCPESGTPDGKRAADRVRELCPVGAPITVISHRLDKYGRVLADVLLPDGRDLATMLVDEGHAVWVDV